MKRTLFAVTLMLLVTAATLAAHDLFLKPARFFVAPGSEVRVRALNGTFSRSEGSVARDRIREITVVSPDGTRPLDTAVWDVGRDTSSVVVRTGREGTYVVGLSVRPRMIALGPKDFNAYLESDGVPDVLESRRRNGELGDSARERYSKHVKAVLQVGRERSDGYATILGYPAELVPLENPYALKPGGQLTVRALVDGSPVANQLVLTGGRTAAGGRIAPKGVRTDADGRARIAIATRGQWYVKFIHMVPVQGDSANYESKWATLTFEVR